MQNEFDILVIGGGPGGYSAALRAAFSGLKTSLIEQKGLGGNCLFNGCIPTKIILHHLKLLKKIKDKKNFGIEGDNVNIFLKKLIQKKDEKITNLSKGLENFFQRNKITLIKGKAKILAKKNVEVDGQTFSAEKIILATGSQPILPQNFNYDGKHIITSEEALNIKEVPENIIIIGAGPVGVEWATIFSILGSKVILIEAMDQILPGVDPEITRYLRQKLENNQVKIVTGAFVEKVLTLNDFSNKSKIKVFLKDGNFYESEKVIIALGRKGNIPETESVKFKEQKNFLEVSKNYETSEPGFYAVGDLIGPPLLAHRASFQGKKLAEYLSGKISEIPEKPIPFCIFSFLEAASCGISQKEAEEKNLNFGVKRLPFGALGIAQAIEENEGFIKVIYEKNSKKILGIHLIGEYASFILGQATTLINCEATLETLENLIQAHPTFSEILGSLPEINWLD